MKSDIKELMVTTGEAKCNTTVDFLLSMDNRELLRRTSSAMEGTDPRIHDTFPWLSRKLEATVHLGLG